MIICANLWTKKLSGKESRELAKQAVITKCRGYIHAEPSRAFIKNKAVDFRAKKKICDNHNIFRYKKSV